MNDELKKVYLIFGEERFLVLENEEKLISEAVPDKNAAMMNHSVYKTGAEAESIIGDCEMMPFMAEKRLVRVRYSGFFERGKQADTEAMAKYIENIPDTTVLLFIENKVDKRNALYKAVKKYGECVEYEHLKPRELEAFVKKRSKNMLLDPGYFVAVIGNDMEKLAGELEKVSLYTGGGKITNEDIDAVCSKSLDTVIFHMLTAVGKKNIGEAIDIYRNMLRAKESPIGILKQLANRLKLILECKYLSKKGFSAKDIEERLGVRSCVASNCIEQGRYFSNTYLVKALKSCYKCDKDIKSGAVTDKVGVELVILGLKV